MRLCRTVPLLQGSGRSGDARYKTAPPLATGAPEKWQYRHCVVCGQIMHRRHYGIRSGVIIDRCKAHGVWLDSNELPRILAYLRSGQEAMAKKVRAAEERPRSSTAPGVTQPGHGTFGFDVDETPYESFVDLLGDVFRWVFKA